jgi:FKBP-type peptidyl-prolyl cis-trans isomerase
MDNIEQRLAELELGVNDLPPNIQKLIEGLDYQAQKLEQQIENYEAKGVKNEELETKFSENFQVIESKEAFVISKIEDFKALQDQKAKEEADADAKAKAEAEAEAKAQAKAQADAEEEAQKAKNLPKEKSKLGFGGIIIGVAVLAITMGAVNTMRSK